jgi:hypothetical protein
MLEKKDGERERECVLQWHAGIVNGCYPGPTRCSLMWVFSKSRLQSLVIEVVTYELTAEVYWLVNRINYEKRLPPVNDTLNDQFELLKNTKFPSTNTTWLTKNSGIEWKHKTINSVHSNFKISYCRSLCQVILRLACRRQFWKLQIWPNNTFVINFNHALPSSDLVKSHENAVP